jgi:hypothetical protein
LAVLAFIDRIVTGARVLLSRTAGHATRCDATWPRVEISILEEAIR